jgi:hypothetical protein
MSYQLPVYASVMQKPFDIEMIARQELRRDRLFSVMTPDQRTFYIDAAQAIGAYEATPYRGQAALPLAQKLGTTIEECNSGNVIVDSETYAEYDVILRRIRLYRAGIVRLAERLRPTVPEAFARDIARDLLIAHELFHHLEATRLGPVHKTLPPITVPIAGGLCWAQRYVLRTREIAAHSFAHTLLGISERFPIENR